MANKSDTDLIIELQQALLDALIYVEDALENPFFKRGVVKRDANAVRSAIAKSDEWLQANGTVTKGQPQTVRR